MPASKPSKCYITIGNKFKGLQYKTRPLKCSLWRFDAFYPKMLFQTGDVPFLKCAGPVAYKSNFHFLLHDLTKEGVVI